MTLARSTTAKGSFLRSNRSELYSEAELRGYVDKFYECLPTKFVTQLQINDELRLQDTRMFRNFDNRYLDSSFTKSDGSTAIIEFKKGILTPELINECGFTRGYFQLCFEQIPRFTHFIFIAEEINYESSELFKKLKKMNPANVKIEGLIYQDFLKRMFGTYQDWEQNKAEVIKNAVTIMKVLPNNWLDDTWLLKVVKSV